MHWSYDMSSDNVQASVNVNHKLNIDYIEVTDRNQTKSKIARDAVLKAHTDSSIYSYVDKCYCQINNNILNAFPILAIGNEIKIIVSASKNSPPQELFYGVIRKRQKRWDKAKDLDITEFWATSFATDASTKMLYAWQMEYTKGYGDVLKKLADMVSVKSSCAVDKSIKGSLYFDHMSVLDAMRFLAYTKGWCLSFKGKTVKLAPCERPKHSGVTINVADLPMGTITEG